MMLPALCLMLSNIYYAQYDAGIIGLGLGVQVLGRDPRVKQSYFRL